MPTQRLSILAAAAALQEFTAAELAAYTSANANTVRQVLHREQAENGIFETRRDQRPFKWRLKDPEVVLDEIVREEAALVEMRASPTVPLDEFVREEAAPAEMPTGDSLDEVEEAAARAAALVLAAEDAAIRSCDSNVKVEEAKARSFTARSLLHASSVNWRVEEDPPARRHLQATVWPLTNTTVAVDSDANYFYQHQTALQYRAQRADAFAAIGAKRGMGEPVDFDDLKRASAAIANGAASFPIDDTALWLARLVNVSRNQRGILSPVSVLTEPEETATKLFPNTFGNWRMIQMSLDLGFGRYRLWYEDWVEPLLAVGLVPGTVISHRDTPQGNALLNHVLLESDASVGSDWGQVLVVASNTDRFDTVARVARSGGTFFPVLYDVDDLTLTVNRAVERSLPSLLSRKLSAYPNAVSNRDFTVHEPGTEIQVGLSPARDDRDTGQAPGRRCVFESTAVIDNGSFGTRTIRFETGRLAQQAAGAVVAYLDDETMLLSATTASKTPKDHFDFFPLTIDVEERMYAAGRIPGSFFRREGRPSTDAILTCRLIDRPLRPTFISGLRNEIQVVVTVLSLDPKDLYDVLAINAASASTQISGLPFSGPVGGVRVALINGQWVAFPTVEQLEGAVFDMVVAGRKAGDDVAIMMVEAEATENVIELIAGGAGAPTESVVAEGLEAAKPFIAALCTAQEELHTAAGKETADYPVFPDYQDDVYYSVASVATEQLSEALTISNKGERDARTDEIKVEVLERLGETYAGREKEIGAAYRSLTKKLVRQRILTDHFRIDGRGITDIRALSAEVAIIPRAHGSALFERGETQIMGVTTLDMVKMAQQIDSLGPETSKRYMHHYNFPPYSTGETGRVGSPKRREIGHGALAERALMPVLPSIEEFPYAIRQVSEALGSNGSTSMGSVCASTLSLLNAGVPLKAPVAGIAMGLVSDDVEVDGKTERRFVTLTDILGAEDAFGDMDFKCAGTKDFVTALQLDTKLDGIPSQVLAGALAQAKDARITILEVMAEAIDAPDEMSPYAPRITTIKVPIDKIGEVIGPKGKMINSITEETGASISIEDDGTVFVGASNGEAAQAAIDKINAIANPQLPKVGERFLGTVVKTTDFGAFVSLLPGRDGLVHISKLGRGKRINKVEDVVKVGDKLRVEIADIDNRGKISLILVAEEGETAEAAPVAAPDVATADA